MNKCFECKINFDHEPAGFCWDFYVAQSELQRDIEPFCTKECEKVYRDRLNQELLDELKSSKN